jgi:hypothetical protein
MQKKRHEKCRHRQKSYSQVPSQITNHHIRFEAFTAVTNEDASFWNMTPWSSCKNRRFGEHITSSIKVERISQLETP